MNCGGKAVGAVVMGLAIAIVVTAAAGAAAIPAGAQGFAGAAWMQGTGTGSSPPPPPLAEGEKKGTSAAGAQDRKPGEGEKDKVLIDADDLRYDGQRKVYLLRRNVHIKHKDAELFCDWAEYHEDTDTAVARGHLALQDPENRITGDVINVDFTDEIAVVEGNVVIVTQKKKKGSEGQEEQPAARSAQSLKTGEKASTGEKAEKPGAGGGAGESPGPSGAGATDTAGASSHEEEKEPRSIEELRERKTTIYCTKLRYHYTEGERYAWLTGPIRAEQKDRTAWADRAEYDGEDGTVKLMGHVRVKTKQGDEFQCPMAIVSVEDEWLKAEKVSGVAVRRKKKTEKQQTTGAAESSGQAKPPAPAGETGKSGG